MLFALIIHHKTPTIRVRPLKGSRAKYVPVLGSTPRIPNLSVEVPEGSVGTDVLAGTLSVAVHRCRYVIQILLLSACIVILL